MGYTTTFHGAFLIKRPASPKDVQMLSIVQDAVDEQRHKDAAAIRRQIKWVREMLPHHAAYLNQFAETRRMARDAKLTAKMPDPLREAVGLPVGEQGGYYVGASDRMAGDTPDVIDHGNKPPVGQPGLWCQWQVSPDRKCIQWDEGEKFYNYIDWLSYIGKHFLLPWGYVLNGKCTWVGEDSDDRGLITIKNNIIDVKRGRTVYR